MPKDSEHHTMVLDTSTRYDQEHYGVMYRGRHVYQTTKSTAPTRLVVWDNTKRPNPDNGKQLGDTLEAGDRRGNTATRWAIDSGHTRGRYLDPMNRPTDSRYSLLLTPESSAMCADTRMNTGQPGSGQVYSQGRLGDMDTATLVYPDGTTAEIVLHFPKWHNGHGFAVIDNEEDTHATSH
jgi:hypothetical protein